MPDLTSQELRRYGRHLVMPEVTVEGQKKLKAARILCVGAGGLGSPVGLYLAAAGIGTLGIVEYDTVDLTNIQRQVLYSTADVGRPKLDAAAERLGSLNTDIEILRHDLRLSSNNIMSIVADYDVIVDGSDNFPTRYLVNDACVLAGKPNVYGSVFRFEGQVSVFDAARGPCYRCLFPEPPPPGAVPSCAEGGVLGVLPGIIGTLQALEAIKLVLGIGDSLAGRLLLFDALAFEFRELKIRKDEQCAVCGASPSVTSPIDYDVFCQGTAGSDMTDTTPRISVREFADLRSAGVDLVLLDVRNAYEVEIAAIPGAVSIPLDDLPARMGELDASRRYVVTCHHGPRAARACELLAEHGFSALEVLDGGLDAWALEIDPDIARYG
jgi:sulfur-carrier protein adenylyltransferase/sulfurtransferase